MIKMEILRISAAAIAFALCTFEGSRRCRELKERAAFLAETELLIERFAIEIRYSGRTTDELLERENGRFAALVRSFADDSPNIRTAWERACDTLPQKRGETALLRELGKTLGAADKESTLMQLERFGAETAALKTAAENEYAKRGKALFQVGTLCGLGAAILII